jgi:anthranilate synthase component 2
MSKILVFDNYDSFTYNLVHLVEKILHSKVDVCKNDDYSLEQISAYDQIILSPGPGLPIEAGLLLSVIKHFASTKKILGVCLGHQAIGEAFGAKLKNLPNVFHGVSHPIKLMEPVDPIFNGIPQMELVGRYHSWVIDRDSLPNDIAITAVDLQGNIMAIRHQQYDLCGVQFHPESILTPSGEKMMRNWLFY